VPNLRKKLSLCAYAVASHSAIRNRNPQSVNGQHPGHSAPDQIDSQYRADHQGDANGGGVKNAQSPAACPGRPSVCGVDEQGFGFAATADRSRLHPLLQVREVKKELVIVISTDKGLAGALNTNLLREAARFEASKTGYIVVGRKARQFLARTKRELLADFELKDAPTFVETKPIARFAWKNFSLEKSTRFRWFTPIYQHD
jgi:hypothetical protein